MDGNENATPPTTAASEKQEQTWRRQSAMDLAIRALGPSATDVDALVKAAEQVDNFLVGEKAK